MTTTALLCFLVAVCTACSTGGGQRWSDREINVLPRVVKQDWAEGSGTLSQLHDVQQDCCGRAAWSVCRVLELRDTAMKVTEHCIDPELIGVPMTQ